MIPLYTHEEFLSCKSRQKLALQCKHCGKTFYKEKHRIQQTNGIYTGTLDFCSKTCFCSSQDQSVSVYCEQCGISYKKTKAEIKKTKHHFCSRSCSCTYHNIHKTKGTRCSKLEKWLATKLPLLYPNLEFHFNRKDAINSELDIYIPSLKLAFELNGIFHYEPIFSKEKLASIQNNDNRKIQACLEKGIELCIIDTSKQTYFKDLKCIPYLKIIQDVIMLKISSFDPSLSTLSNV